MFLHTCAVRCDGLQHVLDATPDGSSRTRLGYPRTATPLEKRFAFDTEGIASEKNHPQGDGRRLQEQVAVEGWPIQVWHPQVQQEHIIAMRLQLA
jgi:hypothetical protein